MMLVSSAVFSAVLAGPEVFMEDEDLEDEDEQRNKWKMKIVKDWTEEEHECLSIKFHHSQLVVSFCFPITNSLEQRNKMKMNNGTLLVQRKMEIGKDWTEEEFEDGDEQRNREQKMIMRKKMEDEIISVLSKIDGPWVKHVSDVHSIIKHLSDDSAHEGTLQLHEVKDAGASFSLTKDLCIPLPPRHRPRGLAQHNLQCPRALSIQRLPRRRHAAHVWIYDTGASFSLTEDLSIPLPPRHRPRGLAQHNLQCPRALSIQRLPRRRHAAHVWIYDTGAIFSLTENLSLLHRRRLRVPVPVLHHQLPLPPVWIYDTGASFSLTGDLSLLPGVCSTGDCSPFLGLRRADPVSAANGQSVASGALNLSRTAPQTTGLISSFEPIAADNSSLLTPDTTPEQTWRVASAAPQHMTGYLNHLIDYTPASGDQVIDTPNMGPLAVHGRGSVNTANITLQDVLYVPCLDANLVSTGQLAQLGYMTTLGPYGCRIYKDDEDMPLVGEAHYVDGYLLELDFLRVRPSTN